MITSSNGNIFRVTGHLCGEFTGPRWIPHTKASDAELWCFLRLNKRFSFSKHWSGWWFETLSHPLWSNCNALGLYILWEDMGNIIMQARRQTQLRVALLVEACTISTHLPPGQNARHFADDVFRCIFVNGKFCILIRISLEFVPTGPIDNNPALV